MCVCVVLCVGSVGERGGEFNLISIAESTPHVFITMANEANVSLKCEYKTIIVIKEQCHNVK